MNDKPLTRDELRAWLDRKPPQGSRRWFAWRDFEPETCAIVEAGNGFRAVRVVAAEALDLRVKDALLS